MPSREHVQALIDGVRAGSSAGTIAETVARFYEPGVLPAVAGGLRQPQVVAVHDAKVVALLVDGDCAVIVWAFEFQPPNSRRRLRQRQVWVQTWKDDKVVAESRYPSGRGGPLLLTTDGLVLSALRPSVARAGLVLCATLVAFAIAEVVVRQFPQVQIIVQPLDEDRQPLDLAKVQRPLDPATTPPGRPGRTLAPGLYHLFYPGLQRPWLDQDGTIPVRINRAGIRDLTAAIKLAPRHINAHYLRGVARQALKEYAAAIKDYRQALSFLRAGDTREPIFRARLRKTEAASRKK